MEHAAKAIDDGPLVTISEAAALMRVSKMTVYRLVHEGALPAMQIRRSYRIRRPDLETYLRRAHHTTADDR